jgi:uncharacterized membrane protein
LAVSANASVEGKAIGIASVGHVVFAITLIALGIMDLMKQNFAAIWQPVPKDFPARTVLIYLCGLIPLAAGLGLLLQRTVALAARVLLIFVLLWLALLRVPPIFSSFSVDVWWAICQTMVMVAAAWILYAWFATDSDKRRLGFATGDNGIRIARIFYGLALIPFGLAHFLYLNATAPLIPGWIPAHVALSYFTGATFIIAGVAIIIGVYGRLAAALSTLQIGLFTLVIWVPIVVKGANAFQWSEFVVSCALTAAGWVVADSYRGIPWLAMRKPNNRVA